MEEYILSNIKRKIPTWPWAAAGRNTTGNIMGILSGRNRVVYNRITNIIITRQKKQISIFIQNGSNNLGNGLPVLLICNTGMCITESMDLITRILIQSSIIII